MANYVSAHEIWEKTAGDKYHCMKISKRIQELEWFITVGFIAEQRTQLSFNSAFSIGMKEIIIPGTKQSLLFHIS